MFSPPKIYTWRFFISIHGGCISFSSSICVRSRVSLSLWPSPPSIMLKLNRSPMPRRHESNHPLYLTPAHWLDAAPTNDGLYGFLIDASYGLNDPLLYNLLTCGAGGDSASQSETPASDSALKRVLLVTTTTTTKIRPTNCNCLANKI